jgi:hypothetical protein
MFFCGTIWQSNHETANIKHDIEHLLLKYGIAGPGVSTPQAYPVSDLKSKSSLSYFYIVRSI